MENEKRLISAEQAYEIAMLHHKDFAQSMADLTSLREVLGDCDTVDAVEVVRCKDCKHYSGYESCGVWHTDPNPDDFCSYGERREGE